MTDNKLMVLPDVQSSADRRNIPIRRVGVKGIRTPILVKSQSGTAHRGRCRNVCLPAGRQEGYAYVQILDTARRHQ